MASAKRAGGDAACGGAGGAGGGGSGHDGAAATAVYAPAAITVPAPPAALPVATATYGGDAASSGGVGSAEGKGGEAGGDDEEKLAHDGEGDDEDDAEFTAICGAVTNLGTRPQWPRFVGVQWGRGVWASKSRGIKDVARCVRCKLMPKRGFDRVITLLSRPTNNLLSIFRGGGDADGFIFVDRWRRRLLEDLLPLVRSLQRGELHGQENCRVILGQRGVGKTAFLRALLGVAMLTADAKFAVVSIACKDAAPELSAPITAVHAALKDMGFEALPDDPWERVDQMNDWLLAHNVRILVAVDEVEHLYTSTSEDCHAALRQFHAIGNLDGARHVIAIVTGSAPRLRTLLFRKEASLSEDDRKEVLDSFPGIRRGPDMNSRKYLDLHLLPPPFNDFETAYEYATRPNSTAASEDSATDASEDGASDDTDDEEDAGRDDRLRVRAVYIASRGLLGSVKSATVSTAPTFSRLRDRLRLDDGTLLPVLRMLASRTGGDERAPARVTQQESGLSLKQLYNYHDFGCIALFEPKEAAYVTLFCPGDVDAVRAFVAEREHPGGLKWR